MKKLLFTLTLLLGMVISAHADKTVDVDFSTVSGSVQYAEESHTFDDLTINIVNCHINSQLRIYSSTTNNGVVTSEPLPGKIVSMSFNAGNKVDVLNVYGSNDQETWTLVKALEITATSYNDYTVDFSGTDYTCFKLDVAGTNQIRIKTMSVTYASEVTELTAPEISGVENGGVYYEAQTISIAKPELATSMSIEVLCNGEAVYSNSAVTEDFTYEVSEVGEYTVKASVTDGTNTVAAENVVFSINEPIVVNYPKLDPTNVQEGQYLIAYTYPGTSYIMKNEVYSSYYVASSEADLTTDVLPAEEYIFTIKAVEGGYTIQGHNGNYLGLVKSGNYVNLKPDLTEAFVWTFSGTVDAVQATGGELANYICFNLYNGTTPEFTARTASNSKYFYPVFYRVGDLPAYEPAVVTGVVDGETYYDDVTIKIAAPTVDGFECYSVVMYIDGVSQEGEIFTEDTESTISGKNVGEYKIVVTTVYADGTTLDPVEISFSIKAPIVVNYPKLDPTNVKEGRYIIAYTSPTTSYILKNEPTGYYVVADEFDLTGEALPSTDYIFEIVQGESGYTIKNTADGTYLAMVVSGTYTNLKVQQAEAFEWTFTGTADAVQATGDGMEKFIYFSSKYNNFGAGTSNSINFYPVFYRISDTPKDPLAETVPAVDGYVDITQDDTKYYPEFDFTIASNYSDQIMVTAEAAEGSAEISAMKLVINSTTDVDLATADGIAFSGTSTTEYTAGTTIEFYFELTIDGVTVRTRTYEYQVGGDTMTAITLPTVDGLPTDVYTIDGVCVLRNADAAAINALPRGLYIVGGKKVIK